jgi:hypothetical protein
MGISMTQEELVSVSMLTVSLRIVHAEYHLPRLTLYTEQAAAIIAKCACAEHGAAQLRYSAIVMRILLVRITDINQSQYQSTP